MRTFFRPFTVCCGRCGYGNRPHRSAREGIKMALLDQLPLCRRCGKELHLTNPGNRPLVREVRAQLAKEGLLSQQPVLCGTGQG